ncbi:MAG: hypothetical protein KDD60_07205 [Bdellovibrionales bacterium]|nr:hypothetical protein [Bdellovibrionales bacterium]
MQFHTLSRKQKRLNFWTQFLEHEVHNDSLRLNMSDELKVLRNLLARCWEAQSVSNEDLSSIVDQERKLEQLAQEARLSAR